MFLVFAEFIITIIFNLNAIFSSNIHVTVGGGDDKQHNSTFYNVY